MMTETLSDEPLALVVTDAAREVLGLRSAVRTALDRLEHLNRQHNFGDDDLCNTLRVALGGPRLMSCKECQTTRPEADLTTVCGFPYCPACSVLPRCPVCSDFCNRCGCQQEGKADA